MSDEEQHPEKSGSSSSLEDRPVYQGKRNWFYSPMTAAIILGLCNFCAPGREFHLFIRNTDASVGCDEQLGRGRAGDTMAC